jgi:outer membrane lipoprotein-sorting protein
MAIAEDLNVVNYIKFTNMKRWFIILTLITFSATAFSQTPKTIIARMDAEMAKHEKDGITMTVDVKIPIIGTVISKMWMLGGKMRTETTVMKEKMVVWRDGKTEWKYSSKTNELEISNKENRVSNDSGGDMALFASITEGYDVSLSKETEKAWYFTCTRQKNNKEEGAPKKIDLAVAKGSYYPLSLSTKMSGITITMRAISYGVSEKQVTFNKNNYPDAKIIDKRNLKN